MSESIHQQIRALFESATSFAIVSHIRPDGDAIGSMLGLGQSLTLAGKQVAYALEDPVDPKYWHLTGAQKVRNQFDPSTQCVIVLDCSDQKRTGMILGGRQPDLVIDHHKTNLNFGKINLVFEEAEATAIILACHLEDWGLMIDKTVAECLLTGILADTIGFRTSNVKPQALRVSADLMEKGADLAYLYHQTLLTRSAAEMRYWGQGLTKLHLEDGLLWTELSLEDRKIAEYPQNDDADLVNILSSTANVQIVLILVEQEQSRVKISWRSKEGIDVSEIAFQFGGGGHAAAAGAEISGTLDSVRENLLSETRKLLKK